MHKRAVVKPTFPFSPYYLRPFFQRHRSFLKKLVSSKSLKNTKEIILGASKFETKALVKLFFLIVQQIIPLHTSAVGKLPNDVVEKLHETFQSGDELKKLLTRSLLKSHKEKILRFTKFISKLVAPLFNKLKSSS
jgi:hypothetical protein